MISPQHALAARRLLMMVCALGATLGAHAAAAGGLGLLPMAPLVWGSLASLAILVPRPAHPAWRELSPWGILARLAALQISLHCAMTAAPWAFGLAVHHRTALVTPLALIAHAVATILLATLLARAERLLSLAQAMARAVRRALARTTTKAPPHPARAHAAERALRGRRRRAHPARGPPLAA